jgi:hypothetical protein
MTASGTSQQSPATSPGTNMICVQSDETIHVARGANPTATTDNYKIKAGNEQFFDNTRPQDCDNYRNLMSNRRPALRNRGEVTPMPEPKVGANRRQCR